MKKEYFNVIGVMSGTSLDGVDLAHIAFSVCQDSWSFVIKAAQTVGYSADWVTDLKQAVNYSAQQLQELDVRYTVLLAETISSFIAQHQIENLDAVCSHGHTILHQPQNGITLQIGNLPVIASLIGQRVVCDFRIQDVKLGGQGAPLVPIGDAILFSEYDYCINLGGFSNVSFRANNQQLAFDISPVNTVLNLYANQLGYAYDDKGALAKQGKVHQELLMRLNALDFYKKQPPKSLGLEFVNQVILPIIESYPLTQVDKLKTFTIHVAHQIAMALPPKKGRLLLTGGGAYNAYLVSCLQDVLPELEIILPEKEIIEYKEALIFGLLGVLKLQNKNNVLKSVTGAIKDHSSGMIYEY
ncbi:anhydro-N-acetylmuramic acid kinase [Flavobacterium crassostreae]|uniref:Anhydro-N-acetylmuramic acid kinase n=1 Tax=Flavobacterium crassostreae TaxID=1763534 RepID=A0A1B9DXD9_9FLAO|nr:anhydro-N-acetylmuramic acid kinase [Flavobacterium crassostreae]OCB74354.1 anhydro-N-acetylmuramic acid kinase [Flavobacterium crassostreae]